MQSDFYIHKLCPLQDKVLNFLKATDTGFYLTGGTALSRCYLHHHYSDDLDFFMNFHAGFEDEIKRLAALLPASGFQYQMAPAQEFYARIMFAEKDVELKVEFVNDVGFHSGDFNSFEFYHKVDNPMNILSNKICALSRRAAKDIADLIFLSRNYAFRWDAIVKDARKKGTWVNELDAVAAITEFPLEKFKDVNFIHQPSQEALVSAIDTIAKELLLGVENSLFEKK